MIDLYIPWNEKTSYEYETKHPEYNTVLAAARIRYVEESLDNWEFLSMDTIFRNFFKRRFFKKLIDADKWLASMIFLKDSRLMIEYLPSFGDYCEMIHISCVSEEDSSYYFNENGVLEVLLGGISDDNV